MSISWYNFKIKKQQKEYDCYIRFRFDCQMQSIKIKAFIYLFDSEGNIVVTEKKNKLGYDPRILSSLTVEKNFLNHKRKSSTSINPQYYEVMKYQGNFNICNLPIIDDYFRNGKALIYQYKDMLNLMDNKKYKIQMNNKVFTIILDVVNYGFISLNLFSKLEDVEKQELIFLQQNEDALCHRYFSNKYHPPSKNKNDPDEIEIIEENDEFSQLGGRIFLDGEESENSNIDEDKDKNKKDYEENKIVDEENNYDINSQDSSIYDYKFVNGKKGKLIINNKIFINGKDHIKNNLNYNLILNKNIYSFKRNSTTKSKSKASNDSFNYKSNNNENCDNLLIKLKKEDCNIFNYKKNKTNNNADSNPKTNSYSSKKESNSSDKDKKFYNKNVFKKDININNNKAFSPPKIYNFNEIIKDIDKTDNTNNNLINRTSLNKTNDSLISNEAERKILLCSSGFESIKSKLKLIYKATVDGDNILNFHKKCDKMMNIFIIILTLDNKKFGFYSSLGLTTEKKYIYDNKAFLFKLTQTEMDCFFVKKDEIAFYGYSDYILFLGGEQLIIKDNFLSGASSCGCKMKNYKINTNYQINNGNRNFIIKELEVYSVWEM